MQQMAEAFGTIQPATVQPATIPGPPPHPSLAAAEPVGTIEIETVPGTPERAEPRVFVLRDAIKSAVARKKRKLEEEKAANESETGNTSDVEGSEELEGEAETEADSDTDSNRSEVGSIRGHERLILCIRVSKDRGPWFEMPLNKLSKTSQKQLTRNVPGSGRRPIAKRLEFSKILRLRLASRTESLTFDNNGGKDGRLPSAETWRRTPNLATTLALLREAWAKGVSTGAVSLHIEDNLEGQLMSFVNELNAAFGNGWQESIRYLQAVLDYKEAKETQSDEIDVVNVDDLSNESEPEEVDLAPPKKKQTQSRKTVTFAKNVKSK